MTEPAIQVEGLWKKFRKGLLRESLRDFIPAMARRMVGRDDGRGDLANKEFWALKDVSFQVERGESMGIIGPNGAGKSTLLRILTRVMRPDRGRYVARGRVSALISVGAGFHPELTGRENIYLNGTILGMTRKEIKAKEARIVEFAGIGDFINTPVKRYSSGMGARLGFAVAAHLEPDVLMVDEVLSVGDALFRDKCIQFMKKLVRSDVTVVFCSHLLNQVRALCPRTIVLDGGQVVFEGSTEQAIQKYFDILGSNQLKSDSDNGERQYEAEIRDIRFLDADGCPTLNWRAREQVTIEFTLVVHDPNLEGVDVAFAIATAEGDSIGCASPGVMWRRFYKGEISEFSWDPEQASLVNGPGAYRVRYSRDRLPLNDRNLSLEFGVFGWYPGDTSARRLWATPQNIIVKVDGDNAHSIVDLRGVWEVTPQDHADTHPVVVRGGQAAAPSVSDDEADTETAGLQLDPEADRSSNAREASDST